MVLLLLTDELRSKLESVIKRLPNELAASILFQLNPENVDSKSSEDGEIGGEGEGEREEELNTINHKILVGVSEWAKVKGGKEESHYRISKLLELTNICVQPLKPRQRSAELIKILSKIQQSQDKIAYESMTSLSNPQPTSLIPLNDIHESSTRTSRTEAEEWKEVKKQTSAIMNVVASMFAVGTAVWWVGGGRSYALRLALAFSGAVAIAMIEGFLYWRLFSQAGESKSQKKVLKFEAVRSWNPSLEVKMK